MFGKSQNLGFECLEKPKFRIPMFGKTKFRIPLFGKNQNLEFQCVEKLKFRMAMFRKANIYNSNVWKKLIFGIPMFGKKKI